MAARLGLDSLCKKYKKKEVLKLGKTAVNMPVIVNSTSGVGYYFDSVEFYENDYLSITTWTGHFGSRTSIDYYIEARYDDSIIGNEWSYRVSKNRIDWKTVKSVPEIVLNYLDLG